jgi:serine/threonine-protein kinase
VSSQLEGLRESFAGRLTIERELGRGGMATVYLAHDMRHDRAVALKVLRPELVPGLGTERFLREIAVTARLDHPHILPLLDSGDVRGTPYYLMPYVEGESLRDRLRREKQLPLADALRIAREVADALSYAHDHGVIHRDIKPENILLAAGHARVADFGIARAIRVASETGLTETGLVVGTPAYMSPEHAAGDRGLDARSDVYGLGCVVYEMLAGQPPYTGATPEAILARRSQEPLPSLRVVRRSVPFEVERTIARALAIVPADRFPGPRQFADALERGSAEPNAPSPPWKRKRRRVLLAAGVALAVLGGTSWLLIEGGPERTTSLAVLPFANVGGDTAQSYFADGVTDEVITALAKVPGLRVAGRSSAFRFRGHTTGSREVGRALNVSALLEGTVRRDGQRVRITTQLSSAADGLVLWSESYERELRDVFALQNEIAAAIVTALQVRLGGGEAPGLRHAAPDPAAYDLYLKGLYLLQRRGAWIRNAIGYLDQAIAADSAFGRAHAQLAIALSLLPLYNTVPIDSLRTRARLAAQRSLALDSTIAEAHVALGIVLHQGLEGAKARPEFEHALRLDPSFSLAYHGLANVLQDDGRPEEAMALTRQASAVDPVSPIALSLHTRALVIARRFPEALTAARQAAELDSVFPFALPQLATAQYFAGHVRDARATALAATPGPTTAGQLAFVLGATEPRPAALRRAGLLEQEPVGRSAFRESTIALAYVAAGDTGRALDALERAARLHEPLAFSLSLGHPMFDLLRGSRRFAEVVRAYGLSSRLLRAPPSPRSR